jgi:NADH-quinone oxidoreductase subunit J
VDSPIVFWTLSLVLVGSALAVVLTKNLFHSVLWLALALTGTAGVFLSLNAEFLAAVQLLLYAGGLITVVVFAIVVTERLVGERLSHTNRGISSGLLAAALLMLVVTGVILRAPTTERRLPLTGDVTKLIGDAVLTHSALAFELLGVLLLVALIGAIYFARPEE